MENVILIILLLLALALIAVVLLQRSEGGGLGIGGGGGGVQTRGQGNALTKLTWGLGVAFMAAALAMTIYSAQQANTSSVVDVLGVPVEGGAEAPTLGENLLPPTSNEPLLPTAE